MMETETEDSNSNSSASPSHASGSHGLLKCLPKDDVKYYIFSWNGKNLGAKGWKLKCGREDFDWVYTFHSHEKNKKKRNRSRNIHSAKKDDHDPSLMTWMIKDDHALDLVGWMRASSSLCLELNTSYGSLEPTLETEFILFGASTQHTHKSTDDIASSGSLPNLFSGPSTFCSTISHHITQQPIHRYIPSTDDIKEKMSNTERLRHPLQSMSKDTNALLQVNPRNSDMSQSEEEFCAPQSFSPNVELAAIVIRTPFSQSKCVKDRNDKDTISVDSGGWGLKFLEKSSARSRSKGKKSVENGSNKAESSNASVIDAALFDEQSLRVGNIGCGKQEETTVTVMVPADAHGLPAVKSCRPSSLIERWRFGGKCDCGGWDAGCTLTLFHNQKANMNKLTAANSEAMDPDVFRLFKGKQQHTPAFEMVDVNNDLYLISFQSELAVLQVFAIGVALLNGRDPVIKCSMSSNASNDYIP